MVEYTTHKTNRLTDVLFLNLERWHGKPELARQEIGVLHDSGVILHVIHGFLHEIREQHTLLRLYDQISAWTYYNRCHVVQDKGRNAPQKRRQIALWIEA